MPRHRNTGSGAQHRPHPSAIRLRQLMLALVLAVTALGAAAPAQAQGRPQVRIFNLSDGPVDVTVGATRLFRDVAPGTFSPYLPVNTGVRRITPDQPGRDDFPVPGDATFAAGRRYTLVVIGGAETPAACGGSLETCFTAYEAPAAPGAATALLRLVDPGYELVSVGGNAVLVPDGPDPRSVTLRAPAYATFCLRRAGTDEQACLPSLRLESRGRYTVWAVPTEAGLRAVVHED